MQLDHQTRTRVIEALERLAVTNRGDVKKLQGAGNEWRLRVGEYRVRFLRDERTKTLEVLRVLPRGRAYRD